MPGLDPSTPYSSRLSARSALFTDLLLLLDDRPEPLLSEQYRNLVVEENVLSRSSTAARRKVWAELRGRYLLDRRRALYQAFWSEWHGSKSEPERGLTAYVLLALNDRLVADLGSMALRVPPPSACGTSGRRRPELHPARRRNEPPGGEGMDGGHPTSHRTALHGEYS